jgi:hypothetical protein
MATPIWGKHAKTNKEQMLRCASHLGDMALAEPEQKMHHIGWWTAQSATHLPFGRRHQQEDGALSVFACWKEAGMRMPFGDDPTFEDVYPKAEFSELIHFGIAFAAFIRRSWSPRREEGTAAVAGDVTDFLPSAAPPVVKCEALSAAYGGPAQLGLNRPVVGTGRVSMPDEQCVATSS